MVARPTFDAVKQAVDSFSKSAPFPVRHVALVSESVFVQNTWGRLRNPRHQTETVPSSLLVAAPFVLFFQPSSLSSRAFSSSFHLSPSPGQRGRPVLGSLDFFQYRVAARYLRQLRQDSSSLAQIPCVAVSQHDTAAFFKIRTKTYNARDMASSSASLIRLISASLSSSVLLASLLYQCTSLFFCHLPVGAFMLCPR
jgi:hypothetical protein